ncbi:MAG: gliding motility-associated C-terminal domain-containing protein [Bacteroidetes bacterium]|nr:gliding motility-associated C-terminal domain-containing protein [Bacteroidota bacterium]
MIRIFVTYCCLLLSLTGFAQKQANNWYFGFRAGIDFNQNPPQQLANDGTARSFEGTACISDKNGKLLFYTNGQIVNNRLQQKMKNGGSLGGHQSSTNNAVVVPFPGNDSMYYIFTTGAAQQEFHQFLYSVVDMRGDGGLGEITDKNVLLEDTIFEKIAAVKHCNNRDVWVVIHRWNTDEYHSYLVTAFGVNPVPVISKTGLVINGQENNEIGTLKFNTHGNKLAAVHAFDNNAIELMDFDNTTGIISNPILFHPNISPRQTNYTGVYGAEFSPNGKLLYVSSNNSVTDPCLLLQYDITSNNPTTIVNSQQLIHDNKHWFAGALQMGPDQRIYMAMWQDTAVSAIDNPDVYGSGCNFNYNKIYMGPANLEPVQFGLPTFIQSYFDTINNPYDFQRLGKCTDADVLFKLNRVNGIDSVKWDFGDGQRSQALQPTNHYAAPGFYDVQCIVYKVDCSGLNDTINRKIWIASTDHFLGNDTASCGQQISLTIGVDEEPGVNYRWNTGAVSSKISTTNFGTYWLEIEQNGCTVRDSINVSVTVKPVVNIGPDTSICLGNQVTIRSSNLSAASYLWNTGATTPSITVNEVGTYYLTITQNGCLASDTMSVIAGDCDIFIPNAFTPNNDGVNDYFRVLGSAIMQHYTLKIYNRYGNVMFSSTNPSDKWDGRYKGKLMPAGAYSWSIVYINGKGYTKWLNGSVLIVH